MFLNHNSKDKRTVRRLAKALRARGVQVWLDEWELVPGHPWQDALEDVISRVQRTALVLGGQGRSWAVGKTGNARLYLSVCGEANACNPSVASWR
jgi:nucleotide-binding universal stress UspA family protein